MTRKLPFWFTAVALGIFPGSLLWSAEGSSIEELGKGLDLSILEEPAPTPEATPEAPALHLFSELDQSPRVEAPELAPGIQILAMPESITLVAPNTPRIDTAYRQLGSVVARESLQTAFPLKVVLHADGNVSVGCGLAKAVTAALPAGIDVSPQAAFRLLVTATDVQIADRTHPPVVNAVVELRAAAKQKDLQLDLSEIYFFPLEPGRVLVGLKIR